MVKYSTATELILCGRSWILYKLNNYFMTIVSDDGGRRRTDKLTTQDFKSNCVVGVMNCGRN